MHECLSIVVVVYWKQIDKRISFRSFSYMQLYQPFVNRIVFLKTSNACAQVEWMKFSVKCYLAAVGIKKSFFTILFLPQCWRTWSEAWNRTAREMNFQVPLGDKNFMKTLNFVLRNPWKTRKQLRTADAFHLKWINPLFSARTFVFRFGESYSRWHKWIAQLNNKLLENGFSRLLLKLETMLPGDSHRNLHRK